MNRLPAESHIRFRNDLMCAPTVKLLSPNNVTKSWEVSVLIVSNSENPDKFACKKAKNLYYQALAYNNYVIEYFRFSIKRASRELEVKYTIYDLTFSLLVPGTLTSIRMAFFSCNGFHSLKEEKKMGGIQRMWENYSIVNHASRPHVLLFGGDQEYFDPVFDLPSIESWLNLDEAQKIDHPFTQTMKEEVEAFYMQKYIEKFSLDIPFSNALSSAATLMNWDDHDIFDGWGSYPKKWQNCLVLKGIFEIAKNHYLLFQHHVNPLSTFISDAFIGEKSFSLLKILDQCAVLAVDTRSHRTRNEILPEESWNEIFDECEKIPKNCQHLFVMLPVPIIYPDFDKIESIVEKAELNKNFLEALVETFKSPTLKNLILSPFKNINLLDDLIDHWRSKRHQEERRMLILKLQNLADQKNLRVTFLSGDVHLGGMGEFYSPERPDREFDPCYMPQIISSPMGNIPAGNLISLFLSKVNNKTEVFDEHTLGRLIPIQRKDKPGERVLISKRNWVQLCCNSETREYKVTFYVESKRHQETTGLALKIYETHIPPILHQKEYVGIDPCQGCALQ